MIYNDYELFPNPTYLWAFNKLPEDRKDVVRNATIIVNYLQDRVAVYGDGSAVIRAQLDPRQIEAIAIISKFRKDAYETEVDEGETK